MCASIHDVESQVVDFVANALRVRRSKLGMEKSLLHDLGVDGADGWELLEEFAERFRVDMSTLEIDQHFGPEGGGLQAMIDWLFDPSYRPGRDLQPIRIRDLVRAAATRRWHLTSAMTNRNPEASHDEK